MIRLLALLLLLAGPAAAQDAAGGLAGRTVTFGVLLYEKSEDAPLFLGQRHVAVVGEGLEYGLAPEGPQNGWDVIPARVDISDSRVKITYPDIPPGAFPATEFNGYVLDFLTDCVLFRSARVDKTASTGTLGADDVFVKGARLYIDMGGQRYGQGNVYTVALDIMDCPIG